jgi:hypothetical protein
MRPAEIARMGGVKHPSAVLGLIIGVSDPKNSSSK